ncbi:MAG: type I-F CRISPR-associated protein Csy1 [Chlorobium sp.]|nr:MAG: type I-F CRISPR-associated protein Csy1 [Chlorobium sp.]
MQPNTEVMAEATALKEIMEKFLYDRLEDKLKKLNELDDEKDTALRKEYQLEAWLDNKSLRVKELTLVTHAIKYQNPDARGSSLYASKDDNHDAFCVSTASIKLPLHDVVGNAAALDIYKFLQLKHQEETLLSRMLRNDNAFRLSLPASEEKKDRWFQLFGAIKEMKSSASSDTLAKQIYFPLPDRKYHLLAPLFPTALVHEVYKQVQTRYEDDTKAARKARREENYHPHGYRDYPNLAVQNFGGTKPQNISQLNSERRGMAYLLPSLPPSWHSSAVRPPLGVDTIFPKIFAGKAKRLINELKNFLIKVQDRESNAEIRQRRAELVSEIIDRLLQYSSEIQGLLPGWTQNPECRLNQAQAFWLDPERADDDWQKQRETTDWESRICHEFANWLNATLQTDHLRFGDAERLEWKKLLQKELAWLTPEIDL